MNLTLAIQAGGQSRRMGQNKALMPFLGQPLIERVRRRLAPLADEVVVIAARPEGLEFLGLPVLPDVIEGVGVLGGLYTAIQAAHQPLVAVVACDMPFASPGLLTAEIDLLVSEGADVAIPSSGVFDNSSQGMEPLHAVYRRETCLPAIKAFIDAGERKLISWFPSVKVRVMPVDQVREYDPDLRAFMNLNTPDEFRQAEEMARQES